MSEIELAKRIRRAVNEVREPYHTTFPPDWHKVAAREAMAYFLERLDDPEALHNVAAELGLCAPPSVPSELLQAVGDPELDRLVSVAAQVYAMGKHGVADAIGTAAYLTDACRDYRQRQTDDAKVEAEYEASLRRHHADEREALRSVLQAFRNEVCGMIGVIGMEHLKQQVGTTTVRVLMARIDEADAALDSVFDAEPDEGEGAP